MQAHTYTVCARSFVDKFRALVDPSCLGLINGDAYFKVSRGVKKNQFFHSTMSAERNSYWGGGGERPIALLPIQYTVIKETCCSLTIIGEVPAPRPTHYCVSGGKKGLTERFPS